MWCVGRRSYVAASLVATSLLLLFVERFGHPKWRRTVCARLREREEEGEAETNGVFMISYEQKSEMPVGLNTLKPTASLVAAGSGTS